MKVVINSNYGGFSIGEKVYEKLGFKWDGYGYPDNDDFGIKNDNYKAYRSDKRLIEALESLPKEDWGNEDLKIVEIPDGIEFEIDEYDGWESIHEKHRSWS